MDPKAVYDGKWGFIQIYVWISNLPNILGDEDLYRQTEKEVLVWTIGKNTLIGMHVQYFFHPRQVHILLMMSHCGWFPPANQTQFYHQTIFEHFFGANPAYKVCTSVR